MPVFIAPRAYKAGELIYSEEAFAAVDPTNSEYEMCSRCYKRLEVERTCNECSYVKYCGNDCKTKDSSDHELECGKLSIPLDKDIYYFHVMCARVILRLKGKDWKSITRNILGTEVSFDDLDSHYEEMTTYPKLIILCETIESLLKESIGEENMPKKEDLIKIIGKVKFSSKACSSSTPSLFCFGIGSFKKECIANANYDACHNVMKIWAARKIKASEEITMAKRMILCMDLIRDPISVDSPVLCKCTECSLPYGESVLTKILDEQKAFQVITFSEKALKFLDVLEDFGIYSDVKIAKDLVDDVLRMQEGVLAPTNALHLKLLAVRCLMLEGLSHLERRRCLMELEKTMSAVFGEYFKDIKEVYRALSSMNYNIGDNYQGILYKNKWRMIDKHSSTAPPTLAEEEFILQAREQQM